MEERLLYIDYIKTIAIVLVILIHSWIYVDLFLFGVFSLSVPLFFLVNGYLMLRKKYTIQSVLLCALKVLLLYYLWGGAKMLVVGMMENRSLSSYDFLQLVRCQDGYGYWFLLTMVILYLVYPFVYTFTREKVNLGYLICLVALGSVQFIELAFRKIYPFVGWQSYALLYYLLGYLLLTREKDLNKNRKIILCVVFLCSLILQALVNYCSLGLSDNMRDFLHVENLVFGGYRSIFVVVATCSFALLLKYVRLPHSRIIEQISKCSLGIYVIQDIYFAFFRGFVFFETNVALLPFVVFVVSFVSCWILSLTKIGNWLQTTKIKL